MKTAAWVLVGLMTLLSGCLSDNRCRVEAGLLVCPGGISVEASDVPDDASCLTDGQEIVCDSGDVFQVPGGADDAGEGEEDVGVDEDAERPAFPWEGGQAGGTAPAWVDCATDADGVVRCENGATVQDEEASQAEGCRWHRRPGVGPRVHCDGELVFIPDGVAESVQCEWTDRQVECNDGTHVVFEGVEPGSCRPSLSAAAGGGYEVECGGEVVQVAADEWCGYPSGEFRVTAENLASEAVRCRRIFGDLVVENVDAREIWQLERVKFVSGDLIIRENAELEGIYAGRLREVEGRVTVLGNPSLQAIPFLSTLEAVEGGIEVSGNSSLLWVDLLFLEETADISFGSNESLQELMLTDEAELSGAFLFLDHPDFPNCRGADLLLMMGENAEGGAYVGGLASGRDSRWAC